MGHIERKATCQDCHIEVEQAMATSVHKNLACAACHVKVLGGYEMTSWGPGMIESKPNPFKKYSLYYGPQEPPILIKDQNGRWMPTKIWPNSAGGIKDTVAPKPGLTFRWPKGETRDAYAQLGTFSFPGGNNNYLAWLQVEAGGAPARQVAHLRQLPRFNGPDLAQRDMALFRFAGRGAVHGKPDGRGGRERPARERYQGNTRRSC